MRARSIEIGAVGLACALLTAVSAAGAAQSENQNGLLAGTAFHWAVATQAAGARACEETWTFATDGVLTVVSGEEITTHGFALNKVPGETSMELSQTRLTSNGRPDCQGSVNAAAGKTTRVFLMFLNGGGFFTCARTDGVSCYGVATPIAAKPEGGR